VSPAPWLTRIPSGVLFFRRRDDVQQLEAWLAEHGLPRPSLLDLALERQRRSARTA
jgi:hypothetical protein